MRSKTKLVGNDENQNQNKDKNKNKNLKNIVINKDKNLNNIDNKNNLR